VAAVPIDSQTRIKKKRPNRVGVSPHLRTETDSVSETLYFLVSIIPDDGKCPIHTSSGIPTHDSRSSKTVHALDSKAAVINYITHLNKEIYRKKQRKNYNKNSRFA
jgi:hypothetical protein